MAQWPGLGGEFDEETPTASSDDMSVDESDDDGNFTVSTQAELDAALANGIDVIDVIAAAGTQFVLNDTPDGSEVHVFGQVHVTVSNTGWAHIYGDVTVTITGGWITASDRAVVIASGTARVEAEGSAVVTASGSALVVARGDGRVTGHGNQVRIWAVDTDRVTVDIPATLRRLPDNRLHDTYDELNQAWDQGVAQDADPNHDT